MANYYGSTSELALRQALEDGIKIVTGSLVEPFRRDQVLVDLISIFSGAQRGSEIARDQGLFVKTGDKPAFEAFALLFRYLHRAYGDDLDSTIENTTHTLKKLSINDEVTPSEVSQIDKLLQSLLVAVQRDASMRPLRAPKEYGIMEHHA